MLTSAGHMARDCRGRGDPSLGQPKAAPSQFDSEYSALMAEIGESGPQTQGGAPGAPQQERIPPWRIPENWMTNSACFSHSPTSPQILMPDFRGVGGPPPGRYQDAGYQNAGGQGGYGGGYQQDPSQGYGGYQGGADPYASYVCVDRLIPAMS